MRANSFCESTYTGTAQFTKNTKEQLVGAIIDGKSYGVIIEDSVFAVGIKNNLLAPFTFTIAPNPSKDWINIITNQEDKKFDVRIYDLFSSVVYENTLYQDRALIKIENLRSGTYFVQLKSNGSATIKRLIVN